MATDDDILDLASGFPPAGLDDWHARVERLLKGASFEAHLVGRTADGIRFAPLYTRLEGAPDPQPLGAVHPSAGWQIRQMHGATDAAALVQSIAEDVAGGVSGVAIGLERPGQAGLAVGALSKVLEDVPLADIAVALDAGEDFGAAASALAAGWEGRGLTVPPRGAFDADPLGAMATAGGLSRPLPDLLADVARLIATTQTMPHVTAACADGRPYHNAGASAAQELAAMLATLVAYLRAADASGVAPAAALPEISAGLCAHSDQLVTIAKLRAARRLIWRIADVTGVPQAASEVVLAVTTSTRMLTQRAPETNILRNTLAATAAVIGGADVLTVLPHTTALGPPDAQARRIARNTQHILLREAHLARVQDPAGGSYAIEHLTDDIARKAWSSFQEIESYGGIAAALTSGFVQERITATRSARRQLVVTGKRGITGASAFPVLDDAGHVPPRSGAPAAPPFDSIWPLALYRDAEPFEELRAAADAYARASGHPPTVFIACLGAPSDFAPRLTWVRSVLTAGGFRLDGDTEAFTSSGAVGFAFSQSRARAAVLVSSDTGYSELAEAAAAALNSAGAFYVLLAGRPGAPAPAFEAGGVDGFLYRDADLVALLQALHEVGGRP